MSLSVSVKAWFPTIIGRKLERIHASSGANRSAICGIVLDIIIAFCCPAPKFLVSSIFRCGMLR